MTVTINERRHTNVIEWLLPSFLCQSRLGGRQCGSNACTVISVFGAVQFLEGTLKIPNQLSDLSHVLNFYSQIIQKGNEIYDSFSLPINQPNLEVRQVLQKNNPAFRRVNLLTDMGFFTVQDFEKFLEGQQHQHQRFAAVLIVPPDKSMLLCSENTKICLFESHSHGQGGGLLLVVLAH